MNLRTVTHSVTVRDQQIAALVAPILEASKGRINTHYATCHQYHVECLAARVNDILNDEHAASGRLHHLEGT